MSSKMHIVEGFFTKIGAEGRGPLINRVARAVHDNALLTGASLAVGAALLFNAIAPAAAQVEIDFGSDMGRYQSLENTTPEKLWGADASVAGADTSNTAKGRYQNLDGPTPEQLWKANAELQATDTGNTHMGRYKNLDAPTADDLWSADASLDGMSPQEAESAVRRERILQAGEDLFEYMRIVRGISDEPPSMGYNWVMMGKVDELLRLSAVAKDNAWTPEDEAKLVVFEAETRGFRAFSQEHNLKEMAYDYYVVTDTMDFTEVENPQEYQAIFASLRSQIEERIQSGELALGEGSRMLNFDSALGALQERDQLTENDVSWIPWMAGLTGLDMKAAGHEPANDDTNSLKL